MVFVVTKNVHVDHDDIADKFVEGAYHEDQAALFNAIGRRFNDEPEHLADVAEELAKHLNDSGQTFIKALSEALPASRDEGYPAVPG